MGSTMFLHGRDLLSYMKTKGAKHSFPLSPLTGVHTQPNKFYHIDIFLSSIFAIFLYENIGIYGFFRK